MSKDKDTEVQILDDIQLEAVVGGQRKKTAKKKAVKKKKKWGFYNKKP